MGQKYYCNCGKCAQCKNEKKIESLDAARYGLAFLKGPAIQPTQIHPFYMAARTLWEDVQVEQIKKGEGKYEKTLGESDWTPEEIVHHAVMENVDQMHYLTLLLQRVREMKAEVEVLKNDSVGRNVYEMVCKENDRLAKENAGYRYAQEVVLKAEYDQVCKERDEDRAALADLHSHYISSIKERDNLRAERDDLRRVNENLVKERDNILESRQGMRETITRLSKENTELRKRNETQAGNWNTQHERCLSLERSNKSLAERIDDITVERDRLRETNERQRNRLDKIGEALKP